MIDVDYKKIKKRITSRSMELWGIEDEHLIDPIIGLLLDVFAFELSKIHQEIKISDAKLLERLARILVSENWSLPSPAHALLKIIPSTDQYKVDRKTHFYYSKMDHGEYQDIFFTPIKPHNLVNASIRCIAYGDKMVLKEPNGEVEIELFSSKDKRINDYDVWVGIQIDKKLIKELKNLPVCLLLSNSILDIYLKMVEVSDIEGNEIGINQPNNATIDKEHYSETIERYYQNYLYELDLGGAKKELKLLSAQFSTIFNQTELKEFDEELFWVKLTFPVAFNIDELAKLKLSLNTFPIVNRKLIYRQHSISKNGKVVSLSTNSNEIDYFLNVENLIDDRGEVYETVLQKDINNLPGSYSLYFGDVDQFDQRNAKVMLNKVIQTIREEGSAFSAVGYDLLNAYLEDLNTKLDVLEKKVSSAYKNISSVNEKQYLHTIPLESSRTLECEFWKTNANKANGILKNEKLSPYKSVDIKSNTISLQTDTVGGIIRVSSKEKINSLRYGLISRERIVSKEDVKAFVKTMIGQTLKKVTIKLGVRISEKPNQGLIRTTNVIAELVNGARMSEENKKRLSHSIQIELQHKSVQNIPYHVVIS